MRKYQEVHRGEIIEFLITDIALHVPEPQVPCLGTQPVEKVFQFLLVSRGDRPDLEALAVSEYDPDYRRFISSLCHYLHSLYCKSSDIFLSLLEKTTCTGDLLETNGL